MFIIIRKRQRLTKRPPPDSGSCQLRDYRHTNGQATHEGAADADSPVANYTSRPRHSNSADTRVQTRTQILGALNETRRDQSNSSRATHTPPIHGRFRRKLGRMVAGSGDQPEMAATGEKVAHKRERTEGDLFSLQALCQVFRRYVKTKQKIKNK